MALRNLDDDEKSYIVRTDLGLRPGKDMLIVNEPGLYSLILRSRKPEAKAFTRLGETLYRDYPVMMKRVTIQSLPLCSKSLKNFRMHKDS